MLDSPLTKTLASLLFLASATFFSLAQPPNPAAGLYKTNCVACHGADGRGTPTGKSLQVADFHSPKVQQQPDAQLVQVISEGRGNMPPFGDRLNKNQVGALVTYIRNLGKAQ
jgi:mono/diheme cytochrome c family protein